jgi:hypothetical protein
MKRDDELKRLIHYAKGLGVKVTIYENRKSDNAATWATDGSEIEIFKSPKDSKIHTIISLLHELGHMLWHVHDKDRKQDVEFEASLSPGEVWGGDLPKSKRKKVLDEELAAAAWQESVYKETNMKFPIWKLHAAKEFDMWMYQVYYETGSFPKFKTKRKQLIDIRKKYRPISTKKSRRK